MRKPKFVTFYTMLGEVCDAGPAHADETLRSILETYPGEKDNIQRWIDGKPKVGQYYKRTRSLILRVR